MPPRQDRNKVMRTNNRFSSLAPDKDSENSFKRRSGRSESTREKTSENSRFKDLETKKNIFSKPSPRENSRWRRDDDVKDTQNHKY